jgi:hypothetical protein
MLTRNFWAGFASAFALAAAGVGWMAARIPTNIAFPSKTVVVTEDYAQFSGSIVDKEQNPSNGTTFGECDRQSNICRFYTIDQIGPNQVSSIKPFTLKIRRWDDNILIADTKGNNSRQCYYFEISIHRASEEVSYTRYRQQNDGFCADGEPNISYWKIDDSYSWQRLSNEKIK